jgi:hypothetical protein
MVSINSEFVLQILTLVILVTLLSLSFYNSLANKPLKYDRTEIYKDKDGVATLESQQKYSVRIQNILLLPLLLAGLALGLSVAILGTLHSWSSLAILWIGFSPWVN